MFCLSFQIGVITVAITVDRRCLKASSEYARFPWGWTGAKESSQSWNRGIPYQRLALIPERLGYR